MKIANAPCSWGILEFGLDGKTDSYDKVMDEMLATGYDGTELGDWGFFPTNSDELKAELSHRNLNLVGAFVPVNFVNKNDHQAGEELALKTARLMQNADPENARIVLSDDNGKNPIRTKNTGRIKPEHQLSDSQWSVYAAGAETVARRVYDETGLKSVFHHHCAGYVETPDEIEELLKRTDPELLSLCFDTGHYAFGGGNPVDGLKKFYNRIDHVHFKDWDQNIFSSVKENSWDYFEAVGNGIFCELGKGSIDFQAVLNELRNRNYTGWIVVEQDILPGMGSPKESALRNRNYLKSLGV
ncbi:MAG: TIM barrel protein [Balneolaceae bacterium]|nr:TIM barrel protein [Balneolaceae bacterium]